MFNEQKNDKIWFYRVGKIIIWDKIILGIKGISLVSFVYCRFELMFCFYLSFGYIQKKVYKYSK